MLKAYRQTNMCAKHMHSPSNDSLNCLQCYATLYNNKVAKRRLLNDNVMFDIVEAEYLRGRVFVIAAFAIDCKKSTYVRCSGYVNV